MIHEKSTGFIHFAKRNAFLVLNSTKVGPGRGGGKKRKEWKKEKKKRGERGGHHIVYNQGILTAAMV